MQILQQVSEALWEALRKALLHKVVRASEGHAAEMYGKIDEHSILMYPNVSSVEKEISLIAVILNMSEISFGYLSAL